MLSNYSSFFEYKSVQEFLKGWTCGTFMAEILNDTDIKKSMHEALGSVKCLLSKYSTVKSSPEGIQDIILYTGNDYCNLFYKNLVRDVLLQANVIDDENEFIDIFDEMKLCEGAMQRPYKMIQIANALSPPVIWNENNVEDFKLVEINRDKTDLLPPNSFYLQVGICENHVKYIMNKVIAVSSTNNIVQKSTFTVQEETISVEDMYNSTCNFMWNHFQNLDLASGEKLSNECCVAHSYEALSASNYYCFCESLKKSMSNWVSKSR